MFQQLLSTNPTPLGHAVDGLKFNPSLEAVVMKGLEGDLGKRWKTVDEFAKAFVQAANSEPPPEEKKGGLFSKFFGR